TDDTLDGAGFSGRIGIGDGNYYPYTVLNVAIQKDGKVLAGGIFTTVDTESRNNIVRFNPDGSLDRGFAPAQVTGGGVHIIVVQSDAKILLGGYFTSVNGVSRNGVARLLENGNRDTTFLG